MRLSAGLCLFAFASLSLTAQIYPGRIATSKDLGVATDSVLGVLLQNIGATDLTMQVSNASSFQPYNFPVVDGEKFEVCSVTSSTIAVCPGTRGLDGTTAISHIAGASVADLDHSSYHNRTAQEVTAIETAVAATAQGAAAIQGFYVPTYNFTPLAGTTNLVAGLTSTVTFPVGPLGIHGNDPYHALYVTGSNAEAVLITGGTCTPGAINCTISFTPTANHASGAWTLMSVAAGIPEALQACETAAGGVVGLPPGLITVYGLLNVQSYCSLKGQGMGVTTLQIAANSIASNQGWYSGAGFDVMFRVSGQSYTSLSDFTIDLQGTTQTTVPAGGWVTAFVNSTDSARISRVKMIHPNNQSPFGMIDVQGNSKNTIVEQNQIINDPINCNTTFTSLGSEAYYYSSTGNNNIFRDNLAVAQCQTAYVSGSGGGSVSWLNNEYDDGGSVFPELGQIFLADSGSHVHFIGNRCFSAMGSCFGTTTDNPTVDTTDVSFVGNMGGGMHCYIFQGYSTTATTRNVEVTGGTCDPVYSGILLFDGIDGLSISNITVDGHGNSNTGGVQAVGTIAGRFKNIHLIGNTFRNLTSGLYITSGTGMTPIDGLIIQGNNITGTGLGVNFPSLTAMGHFAILGNTFWANSTDFIIGVPNGVAGLVANGPGTWGFNVTSADTSIGQALVQSGSTGNIPSSPSMSNGLNSNINTALAGSIIITQPTAAFSLGGFASPYEGQVLFVYNSTSQAMTIVNEDGVTQSASRIFTFTGANVVLPTANSFAQFKYSLAKSRWLLVGHS